MNWSIVEILIANGKGQNVVPVAVAAADDEDNGYGDIYYHIFDSKNGLRNRHNKTHLFCIIFDFS